ncbi:MAG: bifunctional hydroxymethylpyrimidine kinase/phosphomethylpyrimidine kinase [Hyphomicrobiales bacterium]
MTSIALTIAGSDSSGGAGIQADLKTFSALGVYGASVVTALTAQNTQGVRAIHDVPPDFVRRQMDAVLSDIAVDAIKIGMLSNPAIIEVVSDGLADFDQLPIVLDPVMVATSGDALLTSQAIAVLKDTLMQRADIITPNLHEAAVLTGLPMATNDDAIEKQARLMLDFGVRAVLLKGGHGGGDEARDFYCDEGVSFWLSAPRFETQNTHGTGCTLSSAIVAGLAKKQTVRDALNTAKQYVTGAIKGADELSIGKGHGPTHHFHDVW